MSEPIEPIARETRLERRLDRWVARAVTPRGAVGVIAIVSIVITFTAGFLMTFVDRDHYPSLGTGLWWAIQTTTTVGYGDVTPTTVGGRLLAAVLMLFGIGFLTVITAAITSTFVARSSRDSGADEPASPSEEFTQLDDRLARIETAQAALAAAVNRLNGTTGTRDPVK